MVQGEDRSVPSASRTVSVGVTLVPLGVGQRISPVAALTVMPLGALVSVKRNGYAPPTTTARMLYSMPGYARKMRFSEPIDALPATGAVLTARGEASSSG